MANEQDKRPEDALQELENAEVTELDDEALEDVAGGDTNCGCETNCGCGETGPLIGQS